MRFLRHHSNLNGGSQASSALLAEARAEAEHGVDHLVVPLPAQNRKLSDLKKAELAREYLRGMTVYELAVKFSIQRQTVSKHLHRMGVPMRQQRLNDEQIDQAAELYRRGADAQAGWPEAGCGCGNGAVGSVAARGEDAGGGGTA
ncbi:hypothetical protein FOH10_32440 [Nocardia otitidiscaviarum]|uniref:Helix-turn-helix domain-containing protein n=1 Tax=Nocardia otitidiscaviarum TaxID=1823 RepID=A0A516NV40_9NOCA|nr:hypothetical protein [Nocardia otitidiscaviarum]MCP9622162.1 hypothetical protein [Nocardia otitidiscaviarum]QDP82734.1 hypothetical protein FOH10_32440 [Nocardia otitidiscaviarum]